MGRCWHTEAQVEKTKEAVSVLMGGKVARVGVEAGTREGLGSVSQENFN